MLTVGDVQPDAGYCAENCATIVHDAPDECLDCKGSGYQLVSV
jgi:hypothetical protein